MAEIKVIDPMIKIITPLSDERCNEMLTIMEYAGRTCYQSTPKGEPGKFISGIVKRGHESVIEHCSITVEFVTDLGVSHELVRHRVAAYSQESTRYVKYSEGGEFIKMIEYHAYSNLPIENIRRLHEREHMWKDECQHSMDIYEQLLELGAQAQEARAVLNKSLKTSIVATFNMREWRHVFTMRCGKPAHPHIKEIMIPTLMYFRQKFPGVFDDIPYDEEFYTRYRLHLESLIEETWKTLFHVKEIVEVDESEEEVEDVVEDVDVKESTTNEERIHVQPIETEITDKMDYDDDDDDEEDVSNDYVERKDVWFKKELIDEDDPIYKAFKEKDLVTEVPKIKVIVICELIGCYHYSAPIGNKPMQKTLIDCTAKLRMQYYSKLDGIGITPYSCVGDNVRLMTAMIVDEGTPSSVLRKIAIDKFTEILCVQDKGDYLPGLMKLKLAK